MEIFIRICICLQKLKKLHHLIRSILKIKEAALYKYFFFAFKKIALDFLLRFLAIVVTIFLYLLYFEEQMLC